ncbi:MAG: hypothetical protein ATN35_02530 [Epulopiscium sp. Nele67-Bin004]|nr:MAG: hypothetical protein ATN35_02530 [Epulopiscium sp. Nele67-Bin004]
MKYTKHEERMRLNIINRSRKIVIELGIIPVNMSMIAKECKITRSTLYKYYDNKESLLWGIYNTTTEEWYKNLERAFIGFRGTTYDRFNFVKELLLKKLIDDREFFLFNDVFTPIYQNTTKDPDDEHYKQINSNKLGSKDTVRFLATNFDNSISQEQTPIDTAVGFFYGCLGICTNFAKVLDILPQKYGL